MSWSDESILGNKTHNVKEEKMLEANRNRKCTDLVQYLNEEHADQDLNHPNISFESKKKHKVIECPTCHFWHILHISYTMEES